MRILALGVSVFAIAVGLGAAALGQSKQPSADEPFWAWGYTSATDKAVPGPTKDPAEKYTAPGSTLTVALGDIGAYNPPDWFPADHPAQPQIVAHGDMARM